MGTTYSEKLGYSIDEDEYDRLNQPGGFLQDGGDGGDDDDSSPVPRYVPPATLDRLQQEQVAGNVAANTAARASTAPNNNDLLSPGAFPTYDAWLANFLERNPGDVSRAPSAYGFQTADELRGDRGGGDTGGSSGGGSSGGGGGGFGSGGGVIPNTPIDVDALMTLLANINSEGDRPVNLPSPGELPVIEVPGVNLSSDIDNALLSVLRGEDSSTQDTDAAIRNLLESVGQGRNEDRLKKRQLQATETAQLAQQGLVDQLRAQLADAGLISLPGVPQGQEGGTLRRATERIAIPFAQSLRDESIRESELADEREVNALQLATGWSANKASRVLQATAAGTDRQRILSEIALGTLDRNIAWNKYLADFGLQREQFLAEMQSGKIDRIQNILNTFLQLTQQARQGYIGR